MSIKRNQHHRNSFFKNAFLSFLLVSITTTILLTTFLTVNYLKTSITQTTRMNHNMLVQSNYSINYLNEQALRLGTSLYNDKDIIAFLNMKEKDNLVPVSASNVLDKHIVTLGNVDSIYLYNSELDLFFSSKSGEQKSGKQFSDQTISQRITNPDFVSNYDGNPLTNLMVSPNLLKEGTCSYIMFDQYSNKAGLKNALVINMQLSVLMDSVKTLNQFGPKNGMSYIITDQKGIPLNTPPRKSLGNNTEILSEIQKNIISFTGEKSRNQFLTIDGTHYLLSYTNDNPNGWFIIGLVPVNIMFKDIISSSIVSLFIVICVFIFCFIICLLFAKQLNFPIKTINKLITGQTIDITTVPNFKTEEFQSIVSVFNSMQEQNRQLDQLKRETSYSMKQDFLNSLILGNTVHSLERTLRKLERLNLSYLANNKLCMVLFKIDDYNTFLISNNQKEQWVLRFAVVNIAEEISRQSFSCDVFSCDSDKFVLIIKCDDNVDYKSLQKKLEQTLLAIQENVNKCIKLSLSIAYSTIFNGLEHLPTMYKNMKNSILLKLRYGHGCFNIALYGG